MMPSNKPLQDVIDNIDSVIQSSKDRLKIAKRIHKIYRRIAEEISIEDVNSLLAELTPSELDALKPDAAPERYTAEID